MGNLNQFYFMGRLARAPEVVEGKDGQVVNLSIRPGTGGRQRGGGNEPIAFQAGGPQLEVAQALTVGQAVLLRGQLRQQDTALVARVQAIELLTDRPHTPRADRPPRAEGETGRGKTRRRRRGRRRGKGEPDGEGAPSEGAPSEGAPSEGALAEGAPAEGAPTGGDAPSGEGPAEQSAPKEAPPEREVKPLPPPKPIAPEVDRPAEPLDESYKSDMPF